MRSRTPAAGVLELESDADHCWREASFAFESEYAGIDPAVVLGAIDKTREWYWADPERHRIGRLDLGAARREIVMMSLVEVGMDSSTLAGKIAEMYSCQRDIGIQPLPDAIDTVRWLRDCGCRLALLTNGSGAAQRVKISRFGLDDLFDSVLIEGELGFGKPDHRIYALALRELMIAAADAWMVGDNLEWDVAQPQRMGLVGIWVDARGAGLPETAIVRPDRIVRTLSELRQPGEDQAS